MTVIPPRPRAPRPAVCALLFAAVLLPAAARAQRPAAAAFAGKPIASVAVTIEGRPSSDQGLLDLVETRRGEALSMSEVRETITHLYSLGRFEDVRVEAETAPGGGVNLAYRLMPVHTVSKVVFRGRLGIPEAMLRRRMRDRFGETPAAGRAEDVASTLQDYYHSLGYLQAVVTAAPPVVYHNPDRTTLVFGVDAGPRASVTGVEIVGAPLDPRPQVLSRLGLAVGAPYDPDALQQKLDAYVADVRHRGHYEASATSQPRVNASRTGVDLAIDVRPGPLVTVRYEGDRVPADKLADLVPIEREGSVDQDLLEDSARRITDYLRQQGYWKAEVPPPQRLEQADRLTIVFHITRGALYRVAPGGLEVSGNHAIDAQQIAERVNRPAARLSAGDPYVSSRLDSAVEALKALYQENGFPDAVVQSAANQVAAGLVKPVIVIREGQQVRIGTIAVQGNAHVPSADLLKSVTRSREGAPYYPPNVAADRDAMAGRYLNLGYESASVTADVSRPGDGSRAEITFRVNEGPQTIVDHILIVGNTRTAPAVIRREVLLKPGKPLSYSDLIESRRRLSALGLFRRVQIAELPPGPSGARDVLVTVEEALRTTIGYGGGAQIDRVLTEAVVNGPAVEQFEFAPRGFFEIGRRNLGGRNRSVDLYTRVSLRPNPDPASTSMFGFTEYRVVGTYREPRAFGNYGDLTGTAAVEQGIRSTFNFARKGVNAELLHPISSRLRASGRYSFGTTRVFYTTSQADADKFTIDRAFPQVRLSTFSGALALDTRDDLLEPQKGMLITLDGTLSARAIGSRVGFSKGVAEAFFYRSLGRPHLVFAGGARLGLATVFPQTVTVTAPDGTVQQETITDLPASERFFAGGDTTIRGYALDSVGAPATISPEGFPTGGSGLVILNAELRVPVWRSLGAALFVDGGNVFRHASDIDFTALRGSTGFGIRYRSPIGPIRLDLGFKMDRRVIGGQLEPRTALHFSIGEAF